MRAQVAESLAKEMGLSQWKCSNKFLECLNKWHNTAFKVTTGGAASVG